MQITFKKIQLHLIQTHANVFDWFHEAESVKNYRPADHGWTVSEILEPFLNISQPNQTMQIHSIYTNETVRPRLLNTLSYLLLYLVGLNIILPFVSPDMLYYPDGDSNGSLADLLNTINDRSSFTHNASILTLGVSAYYLASIIAVLIIPFLYPQRAGNERSIRYLVKGLTLLIAMMQAFAYTRAISLLFFGYDTPSYAIWITWIVLVTGALLCMWIADKISAQGLMDGRILLLCIGLFIGFPSAFITEVSEKLAAGKLLQLGIELGVWAFILTGILALTQAVRYLPLKKEESPEVEKLTNPNLRIRLNMVDEYPLGLANQFIMLPLLIFQASMSAEMDISSSRFLTTLSDPTSPFSLALRFILVILATYAVVRSMLGSGQKKAFMNQWEASILDVPEGQSYQHFYRRVFRRLTLPLAIILATISILPGIGLLVFDMTPAFGAYFGGFSLFLIISLTTDFISKMELMAAESPSIVGRGTTPDLDLAYEVEFEYEED